MLGADCDSPHPATLGLRPSFATLPSRGRETVLTASRWNGGVRNSDLHAHRFPPPCGEGGVAYERSELASRGGGECPMLGAD